MTDIMVDLETLGTKPGSVILSIGACVFEPNTGEIGETFYINIDPVSSEMAGLEVDPETQAWWSRQSPEAQAALTVEQRPLDMALALFSAWWQNQNGKQFWAHSPNFDEVLLSAAFRACGLTPPWRYSNVRCTRTVYALAPGVAPDRTVGVHHDALADAATQARAVGAAMQKITFAADQLLEFGKISQQLRTAEAKLSDSRKERDAMAAEVDSLRGDVLEGVTENARLRGYIEARRETETPPMVPEYRSRLEFADLHAGQVHRGYSNSRPTPWYGRSRA